MVLLALVAAWAGPIATETTKVRIDGQTYRVTVNGDRVEVANKSIIVAREPLLERDARRRAVKEVTGCVLRDELRQGGVLLGRLDCPTELGRILSRP